MRAFHPEDNMKSIASARASKADRRPRAATPSQYDARVRGNSIRILTDIVMLVRYALGLDEVLEPLPSKVAGKFNL